MKKITALVAVSLLTVAVGASAQSRWVGPPTGGAASGIGPTSLFDVTGEQNLPSGPLSLGACKDPASCSFFGLEEYHWAQNLRYGTNNNLNCRTGIKNTWVTLFDQTFHPQPGVEFFGISFSTQVAITNESNSSSLVGLAMSCTVSQGSSQIPCPATIAYPFLTRQNSQGPLTNRVGNLGFASYHGMVDLANDDDPIRLVIEVRTSDATNATSGAVCYSYVEVTQYYLPSLPLN